MNAHECKYDAVTGDTLVQPSLKLSSFGPVNDFEVILHLVLIDSKNRDLHLFDFLSTRFHSTKCETRVPGFGPDGISWCPELWALTTLEHIYRHGR